MTLQLDDFSFCPHTHDTRTWSPCCSVWSGMMSEQQLRELGLPAGLIRLGVGFEEPEATAADIEAALPAR